MLPSVRKGGGVLMSDKSSFPLVMMQVFLLLLLSLRSGPALRNYVRHVFILSAAARDFFPT
jgi:hypothetical protein